MATISVPHIHYFERNLEGGGNGHENCTVAKGERTFACIAWEGRRGNRGVSEVGRNVLQMWGTVALC